MNPKKLMAIGLGVLCAWAVPMVTFAATPTINSITFASDEFGHKAAVTISGTGFASKSPALPLYFSDFEDCPGTMAPNPSSEWGERVSQRSSWDGGSRFGCSQTSDSGAFSNWVVKTASDWPGGNPYAGISMEQHEGDYMQQFYMSVAHMWDWDTDQSERDRSNVKFARWYDDGNFTNSNAYSDVSKISVEACGNPNCEYSGGYQLSSQGVWETDEWEFDAGVPGGRKMYTAYWQGGVQRCSRNDLTYFCSSSQQAPDTMELQVFVSYTPAGIPNSATAYYDNVYFDDTFSRVMLCEGSRWSSRGKCQPQIPTSWSDGQVQVRVHGGLFSPGSSLYLYVVNQDNEANTDGYGVVLGQPTEIENPAGVTGHRRDRVKP